MRRAKKVDFYYKEITYECNFDDCDELDLYYKARDLADSTSFDCYEILSNKEANALDGVFEIADVNPETHTCTVYWSEIDEEFDTRTEEEKEYDAYCDYIDRLIDREDDRRAGSD